MSGSAHRGRARGPDGAARLLATEHKRAALSTALARADTAIHSTLAPEDMMREALTLGAQALGASSGAITETRGDDFVVVVSYGFPESLVGLELSREQERHAVLAMETGRTVIVEDVANDERVDSAHLLSYGVDAVIVVPLVIAEQAIGCVYFNFAASQHFDELEVDFARQLGSTLSLALNNQRLLDDLRLANERLSDVLYSMADAFVSLDREWRYTLVNPVAERMLGTSADELIGKRLPELHRELFGWPHLHRVMEERVAEKFVVWSMPLETWVEVHAYPTAQGMSILFADVSERKRDEHRIRQHAEITAGIGTILQAALSSRTEEDLGEICLSVAERITGSAFGFIDEIGPDGRLHDIALSDPGWAACRMYDQSGHRRPPGQFEIRGLYGKVFSEGAPFFTNDPSSAQESVGTPEGHPALTSFLGVPLFSHGVVTGVVNVANKEGGYDQDDVAALQALAPVIVEAFERKRAERESAVDKERLDAHIDNSPLAVIEFDAAFRIMRWSDEAEKMFGWKAEEVLGKAIGEFKWVYEEDVPLVDDEQTSLLTAENPRSLNVNRNYRKDGSVIWCEWYDSAIYDDAGEMVSILSQVLDVTERKEAETETRQSEERFRLLFTNMLDGLAFCRMIFSDDGEPVDFEYLDVNERFADLTGLADAPGKRVSELIPGVRETNPEVLEVYGRVARGGGPERFDTEVDQLGRAFSISVYSPRPGYFVAIFHEVSEEKERLRLEEALSSIRNAVGSTLAIDTIVRELATRAAETLAADAYQILMRREDRWVVTDAHGMLGIGTSLRIEQLPVTNSAISERRPVAEVDTGGRATKRRSAMRRFGVKGILVIPLIAQGRAIGAIGLAHAEAIPFTELEMYFATRLASVATLALDNALAYERERAIADTLQEAVLAPPPEIAGIETAYLYRSASDEAAIGGDLYDVFDLGHGKVGLLVGDVSGKGLEAARLTSLVRDGVRAYALERDDPQWVVERLNALVYRSSPVEVFATLVFGVLDVLSGRFVYTSAGHPPGLVLSAEGPSFLAETPAAIVGAFEGAAFTSGEARLGHDDLLLLYTDGVIEARSGGELYGSERLLDALRRLHGTSFGMLPDALLADVLAFTGGERRDDIVIMCVKRALSEDREAV